MFVTYGLPVGLDVPEVEEEEEVDVEVAELALVLVRDTAGAPVTSPAGDCSQALEDSHGSAKNNQDSRQLCYLG